jgi:hypothetical protein
MVFQRFVVYESITKYITTKHAIKAASMTCGQGRRRSPSGNKPGRKEEEGGVQGMENLTRTPKNETDKVGRSDGDAIVVDMAQLELAKEVGVIVLKRPRFN